MFVYNVWLICKIEGSGGAEARRKGDESMEFGTGIGGSAEEGQDHMIEEVYGVFRIAAIISTLELDVSNRGSIAD